MNGVRLGSYSVMKKYTGTDDMGDQRVRYAANALFGAVSGMMGALFASPVYLAKTRLQSQGGGIGAVQHRYNGMAHVLTSVVRGEERRVAFSRVSHGASF